MADKKLEQIQTHDIVAPSMEHLASLNEDRILT